MARITADKIPSTLSIPMMLHPDIDDVVKLIRQDERLGVLDLRPTQVILMALRDGLKNMKKVYDSVDAEPEADASK